MEKKLGLTGRSHVDVHEFAEQLERRLERVEEDKDKLESRMARLEHWQSFVFGAAAAIGALVGVAMTAWGLLK